MRKKMRISIEKKEFIHTLKNLFGFNSNNNEKSLILIFEEKVLK